MSIYRQDIINYGDDVTDLISSPFESLRMLHDRTELHNNYDKLDFKEKVMLASFDLKLIENAAEMVKHISQAYDFNLSDTNNIPSEQWWWHLDKIANGLMDFGVFSEMGKVM